MKSRTAGNRHTIKLQLAVAISLVSISSTTLAANFLSLSQAYTDPMGTSSGWSISGDGSTVVGNLEVANEVLVPGLPEELGITYIEHTQTAFRWNINSAGVDLLPFSNATDTSYDGSVVVGNNYRWTAAGGAQDLGGLGSTGSAAFGVSADGTTVVGQSSGPNGAEAFRWTEATGIQGLGFLPATNNLSRASDVSADGSVVVGSGYGGAFRWTPETGMVNLELVGLLNEPFHGQPNAISADGSTVVGQSPVSWTWTEAGGLNYLGVNMPAYAASADGSVVVGGDQWSPSGGISWIWDETNGMRVLKDVLQNDYGMDLTDWTLYAALGISDDGMVITGVGTNPMGVQEAWVANLSAVPVPPAIWLFGSGILGLLGLARSRKN